MLNSLPKIHCLNWSNNHRGHKKIQGETLVENNGRELILFFSQCEDCKVVYFYDWVFEEDNAGLI
jgi:hypothetical protein